MNQLVKLRFISPVHFGNGRLTDSDFCLAADTLFSALFIEARNLGCSDELLESVRVGDLKISDGFPWIGDTYYLPKPQFSPDRKQQDSSAGSLDTSQIKKAFKKLNYIPARSFNEFFEGGLDPQTEWKAFKLGDSQLIFKVNIENHDDPKKPGDPYHVGAYSFHDNAGLYFIVSGGYDLIPILHALQFSGLGGKRSSGYGRFEFTIEDDCVTDTAKIPDGVGKMLLCSAMPAADELSSPLLDNASYSLMSRSGFVQSTSYSPQLVKKRVFYTFAAGSIFPHTFSGDVYDVSIKGKHPVWRYAKAMWLEV